MACDYFIECETTRTIVFYAGGALLAYKVLSFIFTIASAVYANFLRPSKDLTKYGKWAGKFFSFLRMWWFRERMRNRECDCERV